MLLLLQQQVELRSIHVCLNLLHVLPVLHSRRQQLPLVCQPVTHAQDTMHEFAAKSQLNSIRLLP
jgi:hypothetical protein